MPRGLRNQITTEFPDQTLEALFDEDDFVVVTAMRGDHVALNRTNVQVIPGEADDESVRILTGAGAIAFSNPDATVEPFFEGNGLLFVRITTAEGVKVVHVDVYVHHFDDGVHVMALVLNGNTSTSRELGKDDD
jgi:hypothetical protein